MFMIQGFIQIVLEKLLQISLSSLSQVRNSPFQLGGPRKVGVDMESRQEPVWVLER